MSRLMSVAMTTDAVLERRKTVSRRVNWWEDKNGRRLLNVGDRLTLCRKVQGRKPGEPIDRLAEVEVVDIRRETLDRMFVRSYGEREVELEGFPGMRRGDAHRVALPRRRGGVVVSCRSTCACQCQNSVCGCLSPGKQPHTDREVTR